jgi:hypothetical protein
MEVHRGSTSGIPRYMELDRLIETCSTVRTDKHLSYNFPIKNNVIQGDALSLLLSTLAWIMSVGWSRKTKWDRN